MTLGKKQVSARGGTAVVRDPASRERFSEITSGSSRGQQGLSTTCKDSSDEAPCRRRREPKGSGTCARMSDDRGVTPSEEMEMTSPQWRSHQSWAKGLRTRGGFLRQCGGRLDKTGAAPKLAWRRGWGQTRGGRGVYEPAFQPLFTWEGPRQKAEVSNRTREIWPSGIIGGLRET